LGGLTPSLPLVLSARWPRQVATDQSGDRSPHSKKEPPMSDPDSSSKHSRRLSSRQLIPLVLILALLAAACGATVVSKTEAGAGKKELTKPVSPSLHFWLGNSERNFYGSGPWADGPLEIVWQNETGFVSGRLHPDPWGGTSWPGQPAVDGNRVYFPSADGNVYCIDARDGRIVWKFKAKDSFKATPTIAGDRIIASGLDHHVYCLKAADGTVIWD